jgi:hypothetical protein
MLYDVRMAIKNFAATRLGFLSVLPLTNCPEHVSSIGSDLGD